MVKTGQVWTGNFTTEDATGALATPSVGPVGTLYVAGVATADSVTISGTNPYKFSVTLPALTAGQSVAMYITATISTIAKGGFVAQDIGDTNRLSDIDIAATGEVGLNFDNIKAASAPTTLTNITVPAVTTTATATNVGTVTGNVNGSVGSVTGGALEATLTAIKGAGWTIETLKAIYNSILAGGGGAGAITWPYTLTSSVDATPIADADVWVTSDLAGAVVIASGRTDALGVVTFYLDAGTVYIWRQKSGWDFTNPDQETVS